MLTLALDTATSTATAALLRDGAVLGEAALPARELLGAVDRLLAQAGAGPGDLGALVCGIGPGSFTGVRIGLALARGLALGLGVPVAGVSTLAALAAGAEADGAGAGQAVAVVDARRKEVFARVGAEELCVRPEELALPPGAVAVGDGAVRYRHLLEAAGATVPPEGSALHLPRARFHAALATVYGAVDDVLPAYLRAPDAKTLAERGAA